MDRLVRDFIGIFLTILSFLSAISSFYITFRLCRKLFKKFTESSDGKVTNVTPVSSLLEVKVMLPMKVIFGDADVIRRYEPSEMAQVQKFRIGEGTLGTLFKVVLNSGGIVLLRKIRDGLVGEDEFEFWVQFFGGICDDLILPIQFSFCYGGEAFILYEYLCLGSLEELLHGTEGIQYTPLNWSIRRNIALRAAMAVASIHTRFTKTGESLICGVIKASNILIRTDFSACLSGYETPYLVSPATIIRRNPGRIAPELVSSPNGSKVFTQKSDVYSFGVLLLELITGKRPTVTNLMEYVFQNREEEGLKGIFDKKIGEVTDNMVEIIGITRHCLQRKPEDRPSMNGVVQMIQDLYN